MGEVKKGKSDTVNCPSCGKSVPKSDTCRKCGAIIGPKGRVSLKKVHISMVLLMVIGGFLMSYAYYEATKITPIGDIGPELEGQTVRILGLVEELEYDSEYEKTSFKVSDDTGSITVYGWSEFTTELLEEEVTPSIGDKILVEGKVDVYNTSSGNLITQLEVTNIAAIQIQWQKSKKMDIGDILRNHIHDKVKVEGNVTDLYISYEGSTIEFMSLTLTDQTGSIEVFVNEAQIFFAGDDAVFPSLYQIVRVTGMVEEYKDELEILPSNATDDVIEILGG